MFQETASYSGQKLLEVRPGHKREAGQGSPFPLATPAEVPQATDAAGDTQDPYDAA